MGLGGNMHIYNDEYVSIIEEILKKLLKEEEELQEKSESHNDSEGECS